MNAARIEILCCALSSIDDVALAGYEALLSADELTRLRSFHSPVGAKEFLVARALLRTALAEKLNCAPRELQFDKNTDGKPLLRFPASNWQFNLTHSHDWIALVLCKDQNVGESYRVGIDIESSTRRNNLPAIANRFFSEAENARLAQRGENEWLDYFFAIWTLKEAHAKALGCGLPKILSCSDMLPDLTAGTIEFKLKGIAATSANVWSWLYKLDEHCSLAVVAHGEVFSDPQIFNCVPLRPIESFNLAICAKSQPALEIFGTAFVLAEPRE